MGGLNKSLSVKDDGAKAPDPLPLVPLMLFTFRRCVGMEQAEFIAFYDLNVSQATYSRWERGVNNPPISVLEKLGLVRFLSLDEIRQGVNFAH